MGDKADPQSLETLLQSGYAVASINYRLGDEAIWPAQLQDVVAAYSYVQQEAIRLRVDPDRIALFGASEGGFLVTTAGLALTAEGPPLRRLWIGLVRSSSVRWTQILKARLRGLALNGRQGGMTRRIRPSQP